MDLERRDRCRELVVTARSMCSARVCSSKQRTAPGAGSEPLGYYGPSAGLRSSPMKSVFAPGGLAFGSQCAAFRGIGECQLCRPKPLRFQLWLYAHKIPPNFLKHAGVEPGRRQSLHYSFAIKCRREPHNQLGPSPSTHVEGESWPQARTPEPRVQRRMAHMRGP